MEDGRNYSRRNTKKMKSEEIKAFLKAKEREMYAVTKALRDEITSIEAQLCAAKLAESGLNIGDRVAVIDNRKVAYGIFDGYQVKYGDAIPVIYKEKKDGAASKFTINIYGAKIEKA